MKSLPNVTLISYDNTENPERTLRALRHCASLIQFAEVVLVCRVSAMLNGNTDGVQLHFVHESSYDDAMVWEVYGVNNYVATDYALCIHHDGYIINPDAWRDDWFAFDFIGAPWPREPHARHPGKSDYPNRRVGNTGFCLKSKPFMQNCAQLPGFVPRPNFGGDTFIAQTDRPKLEALGMKYAPVEVAADFSWEDNIEEFPNGRPDAFGFHNFNLAPNKNIPRV